MLFEEDSFLEKFWLCVSKWGWEMSVYLVMRSAVSW